MFFPYFSLFLSRLFFSFFYSASTQSATYKRKEELIYFIFLMANNHFILNESFCFYLIFFLLALPNFVHPKILTRFYSIYFKIPRKTSAQFNSRIENYTQ